MELSKSMSSEKNLSSRPEKNPEKVNEIIIKYRDFYINNKYYIKIGLSRSNKILIKSYHLDKLNNYCYQITLDITDLFNISKHFIPYENINNIFSILINLINNNKYSIKQSANNNLVFIVLLSDALKNDIEIKFILYKTNITNPLEYNTILCHTINKLKNNFIQAKELYEKEKNENKELIENIVNDINYLYQENTSLKETIKEFCDEFKNNKSEINSLKNMINTLNNEIRLKNNKEEDKNESLISLTEFNKVFNTDIKDNKIKELYLSFSNIDDNKVKNLSKIKFNNLQELSLSANKITNIKVLEQLKFYSLKELSLSNNRISDINVLANVKFNRLKKLYLDNNNIFDISVLEKVKFKELEILYLDNNRIRDVSVFNKAKFEDLEELSLSGNIISDINPIKNLDFKKIDLLYLDNNNIDVNISSNAKFFDFLKETVNRLKL